MEDASPITPLNPVAAVLSEDEQSEAEEARREARIKHRKTIEELPDLTDRIAKMGLGTEYAAFRERYLAWRKGEAQGAHGEPLGGLKKQDTQGFGFWYPTVEEWKWRRTLSYWIAVTFFEGSIFFTVSSFLFNYEEELGPFYYSATTGGYIAGKFLFLICTYLMCVETVNLGAEGHGAKVDGSSSESSSFEESDDETQTFHYCPFNFKLAFANLARVGCGPWPYIASVLYFIGVLIFGVALVLENISAIPEEINGLFGKILFLLGSLAFLLGGVAECIENETFTSLHVTKGWLGALFNTLGGVGFLVGAIIAWIDTWWSNVWYGIGSLIFVVGSSVMIIMWKDEQFGLTFLAVLNKLGGPSGRPWVAKDMRAPSEEARFSFWGAFFIHVYCMAGAMSVYSFNFELALATLRVNTWRGVQIASSEFLPFLFCHMLLALASAVVRVPKIAPYRQLFQLCRILAFLMLVQSSMTFAEYVSRSVTVHV